MKKILSIISAGVLALTATSCIQEKLAVFNPNDAIAPLLGNVDLGEKKVTVNYTPAVFNMGFNEQMAPIHNLALVAVNGNTVSRIITSKDDGSSLTATMVNISKALAFYGYSDGDVLPSIMLAVRASMQDPSRDNGRNGFVDSVDGITINNFVVTLPVGSPYADYTQPCDWSVIGALSAYEMNWDKDLEMFATPDGDKFVAKAVTIGKDDQFKFRKDQKWDDNYGAAGDVEPFVVSMDSDFTGVGGGKNLAVPADGIYDLWLDLSGGDAVITVTDAYLAYPEYTQASTWSVIGALSEYGISWDGDLEMTSNGKASVAQGVKLMKDDQFKFRKDKAWDENFGAPGDVEPFVVNLGSESPAAAGGKNLAVPADGIYDLIVDPDGQTYTVVETLGGGISHIIGGDEPEPEPVTGWNIIGANGDWDHDIIATANGDVWTAYVKAAEATEFKWRKDAGWDENYGGTLVKLGEPFEAKAGGDNIKVEAGFYKVVLDLTATPPTITVSNGDVFGLIGVGGDWDHDIFMTLTDGKWVSPATAIEGEFKIRRNASWDENYGGTFTALGEPFEAKAGGDNIKLEAGEYIVSFDPNAKTITVTAALPSNKWSVIGVNGDWNNDFFMTEVAPGIWVSEPLDITSAGWKVRFNHGWDVNRGGTKGDELTEVGVFTAAVSGGENLQLTGKFQVVYNAMNETIGTLGWGVVGSIAGISDFNWNKDIPMNLAPDGKWYSVPVTLSDSDEIKIRWMGGWDKNFGGENKDAVAADTAVKVKDGGDNFKAAKAGTYMVVYDPTAGTVTLSTDFWSLIGDFNNWGGDRFMMPDGTGKWFAYNQSISGGWKIRKTADWAVSAGGTYVKAGEPFAAVTTDGPNIAVTDMTRFDVVYDTKAGNITVSAPVK